MKTCSKCGATKPLDAFGRRKNRADQPTLNGRCKDCVNSACAASVSRNPDGRRHVLANYRAANVEKVKLAYQEWYHKDVQATRSKKRAYDAKNEEQSRARRAKWRAENRLAIADIAQSRRAAAGSYTALDVKRIRASQKNKCAHCRRSLVDGYHIDHITPLKLGGSNDATNIQLLCPPCNLSKGAKDPIKFAQEAGRLL